MKVLSVLVRLSFFILGLECHPHDSTLDFIYEYFRYNITTPFDHYGPIFDYHTCGIYKEGLYYNLIDHRKTDSFYIEPNRLDLALTGDD